MVRIQNREVNLADLNKFEKVNGDYFIKVLQGDSSGNFIGEDNPLQVTTQQWALIKFDPNDSQPDYIGLNLDADANDTDTDWVVYKFTYSGSKTTQIQRKIGAWSDRASLF